MLDWKEIVDGDEIIPDDINLVANELIKTQKEIKKSIPEKQPLDFVVNVITTGNANDYSIEIKSADKTYAEVLDAYNAGKRVYLLVNGRDIVPLSSVGTNNIFFNKRVFAMEKAIQVSVSQNGWLATVVPDYTFMEIEELIRFGDDVVRQELLPKINEKVDSKDIVIVDKSVNLFDNSQRLESGFISRTGSVGSTAYSHFYFPVDLSRTYTFPVYASYTGAENAPKIAVYNTNEVYIGMITGVLSDDQATATVNLAENPITNPSTGKEVDKADVAYLCINIRPADLNTFMIVEGDTYPDIYYSYSQAGKSYINPDIGLNRTYDNPLYGKKISLNGDSICYGSGYIGGFGKMIADNNLMKYQNIAVSGGTIMQDPEKADRHCISDTIANMDEDADYIILEGGVNDASLNLALGAITEKYDKELDTSTFAGAFEHMLKQAILRFSGKKIGYVFVHKMTDGYLATDEDESKETYYTIAKKCCRKWGIPYIDLNAHSPLSRYIPELRDAYTIPHPTLEQGDGWHPNKEGYQKFYVPQIEAWMKTL